MNLFLAGTNHCLSSVDERAELRDRLKGSQGVLLATCNRTELYGTDGFIIPDLCRSYIFRDKAAVKHLFRVASGLDSAILGEGEILGQVRAAHLSAKGGCGALLDRLFEKAVETGRSVRSRTRIGEGSVSVAGTAVSKALGLFGREKDGKMLIIGTGKIAESLVRILVKKGFKAVLVAGRAFEKADDLAKRTGAKAMRFDSLGSEISDADIVISSTSAPHFVVKAEHIGIREKPLIIMDLASPRDVDPAVSGIRGVRLFDLDSVKEEIGLHLIKRRIEAVFAERIVEEEAELFCKSLS